MVGVGASGRIGLLPSVVCNNWHSCEMVVVWDQCVYLASRDLFLFLLSIVSLVLRNCSFWGW